MSDDEEEQLKMVLALSRKEAERADDLILDEAVALSLEEAQWQEDTKLKKWSCSRCTLDNDMSNGRCVMCQADRETPSVSAVSEEIESQFIKKRKRCGLPGCAQDSCRPDGFCSEEHSRRARERRLLAPATEDVERVFVGSSGDHSIALLTRASPDRSEIAQHFVKAWRKAGNPRVRHIYRVTPSPWLRARHDRYAALVGNLRQRYHGTSSTCDFGANPGVAPCEDFDNCALCSILAQGFRLDKAATGPLFKLRKLRYGAGIYLSATSGKSNDYAQRTERLRPGNFGRQERYRCMLVCSVAAGRAYKTTAAELDLPNNKPPSGYDSIVGEVGENLNYDELVVYSEDAALPRYLVIYTI
mmetsp:Transcript_9613/g.13310  ORF Transcript_9613/g.13310 Transcript_9613/m.13310 type:complete len:358 (-) Transcript_9613:106-1179(-)|eukprot:CAMPEP_0197292934 /NCGR_PEP_ID=MMETSP0890-20130614/25935_1 /TAXON_ID=44058 ORGANISM="Aureoumbra lagunensis, Strain CCMP1510" /NCGR_SAMPLE_ID=MMETSP0890 /ASSEMBLY_ACC=CAM_ASM_000533 /LENGTH=357 /DNA_ID=CAMNT_0042767263 /DNA_START=192 /DNA_END=1265 /DNA_ORIENTATION=+